MLTELLPPSLFAAAGLQVAQAGAGALKELLYGLCSRRWPHYQPLARYPNWVALMRDYETALTRIAPGAKVNEAPVTLPKAEIATLFNQKRHAGFESRARQYGNLLQLELWKGSEASVRFVPHPAEVQLADQVRNLGEMPEAAAYTHLRAAGFAASEAEQLLRLAVMRSLVCQDGDRLTVPPAPTDIEIHTRAQTLKTRITSLPGIPDGLISELDAIVSAEGRSAEPAATMWQLDGIEQQTWSARNERCWQEWADPGWPRLVGWKQLWSVWNSNSNLWRMRAG